MRRLPAVLAVPAGPRTEVQPHWLPSPSRRSKAGRSCGVLISSVRTPASISDERIVDHRLVVQRQQLLADGLGNRPEAGARPSREDDSLHDRGPRAAVGFRHQSSTFSAYPKPVRPMSFLVEQEVRWPSVHMAGYERCCESHPSGDSPMPSSPSFRTTGHRRVIRRNRRGITSSVPRV